MDTKRQRTVSHLQNLYTVVVGLALAAALSRVLDTSPAEPVSLAAFPYFVAFLVTMVPIYHGALRHLDVAYFENAAPPSAAALMADWALLFLEGCGLLALALFIDRPVLFAWTLTLFLAFDAFWAFVAYKAFAPEQNRTAAHVKWVIINVATVFLLLLTLVVVPEVVGPSAPIHAYLWLPVVVIAIGRTITDYWTSWRFYYPFSDGPETSVMSQAGDSGIASIESAPSTHERKES